MASTAKTPQTPRGKYGDLDEWHYDSGPRGDGPFTVKDQNGSIVAVVVTEEDARLIAKAPQFYRAVRDLVMSYPQFDTAEEINGGDMVQHLGTQHPNWKKLVEGARWKKLEIHEEILYYYPFV